MRLLSGGVARERSAAPKMNDGGVPTVEWQVVRHDEKEAALKLKPFERKSNRRDPQARLSIHTATCVRVNLPIVVFFKFIIK